MIRKSVRKNKAENEMINDGQGVELNQLAMALYTINKKAKEYRDKKNDAYERLQDEREMHGYQYYVGEDIVDEINLYKSKENNYYIRKDWVLRYFMPVKVHVSDNHYYSYTDAPKSYFWYFEIGDYSFHSPFDEEEKDCIDSIKNMISFEDIGYLEVSSEITKPSLSKDECKMVFDNFDKSRKIIGYDSSEARSFWDKIHQLKMESMQRKEEEERRKREEEEQREKARLHEERKKAAEKAAVTRNKNKDKREQFMKKSKKEKLEWAIEASKNTLNILNKTELQMILDYLNVSVKKRGYIKNDDQRNTIIANLNIKNIIELNNQVECFGLLKKDLKEQGIAVKNGTEKYTCKKSGDYKYTVNIYDIEEYLDI